MNRSLLVYLLASAVAADCACTTQAAEPPTTSPTTLPSTTFVAAVPSPEMLAEQQAYQDFHAARRLETEGKTEDAFRAYLAVPGAEYAAVRLARSDPEKFVRIVDAIGGTGERGQPRASLVGADLLLGQGNKQEALKRYRQVAAAIAEKPGQGWAEGVIPRDYYPVEPVPMQAEQFSPSYGSSILAPFSVGPGSHRDNWLIRRFIALDAWEDAAREFSRIHALHREYAGDGQYSSAGLQFAIDYAFFLDKQKQPAQALDLLRDVLVRIDMDRVPALRPTTRAMSRFVGVGGLARKEFIRLAYGQFRTAGQKAALVDSLRARIDAGHNNARRVLARVRLHQQSVDDALTMELQYIKEGDFNAFSAACRRGMVYEDLKKLPEAVVEYEKALTMRADSVSLPDRDEELDQRNMMQQRAVRFSRSPDAPGAAGRSVQFDLLGRLDRLYAALGQSEKVLETSLRRLDLDDQALEQLGPIEHAAAAFKAAGQEKRFSDWASHRVVGLAIASARANLFWVLRDTKQAASALAELAKTGTRLRSYELDEWRRRFATLGKPALRDLFAAIVEADPKNANAHLELLDLEDRFDGPQVFEALELLLDSDAGPVFSQYKGAYNRTQFKSYFDLAYRLMRLYEKQHQTEKLLALGLRIARGDKPFAVRDLSQFAYHESNDVLEHAPACLALAITYATDAKAQEQLGAALEKSPWESARRQLRRLREGGLKPPAELKRFGWANVPLGVQLLAANENVLSLCRDEEHIYAGHPWGVAVYDHKGTPVTRIALQDAALHLAVLEGALWVGMPLGLDRIDVKTWAVSHMPCDQDVPERDRQDPGRKDFLNGVCGLASDGKRLWIGTRRDIRTYSPAANELRIFSQEDLLTKSHTDWKRFLFDGDFVWADGDGGCRRYDRGTDRWLSPVFPGDRGVRLIGLIDGALWGEVYLNDELRARPALMDRKTLTVTPILFDASVPRTEQCINGPWGCYGRYEGKPVFGPGQPAYYYDPQVGKLRALPRDDKGNMAGFDSPLPAGLRSGTPQLGFNGAIACTDDVTHRHEVFGQPFHAGRWLMLQLPDGSAVLGGSHSRSPRYIYPREDWPFQEHVYETPDGSGGLHVLAGGQRRTLSSGFADTLMGDSVFAAVPDGDRTWVCTDYGLSLLDAGGRVMQSFTGRDGLLGNRISAGAVLDGKVYFATRHDDSVGALVVFDPKTSLFTSLMDSDGLASNALEGVEAEGKELKLTYGMEYRRYGNFRYQIYPTGSYTPASGQFSPRPEPSILEQASAQKAAERARQGELPYLGGYLISRQTIGNQTLLCGTRGLVILRADATAQLNPSLIVPKLVESPDAVLRREAAARGMDRSIGIEQLRAHLKGPNPYFLANALAAAWEPVREGRPGYAEVVAACISNSCDRVRSTAVFLLSEMKDDAAGVALTTALQDTDPYIRAVAALALAQHGKTPTMAHFREICAKDHGYGNLPFGAASGVGVQASRQRAYEVLAPVATPEVFALFMEYPPRLGDYDNKKKVFPSLGAALLRHPEAAEILLKAYDDRQHNLLACDFAQNVFGFAGKEMLPVLYKALESPDRVVRANAARGCGAVGDPAAIPRLITALDLESGLSRAGIVWALGELKAAEALPQLAKLYIDARNDVRRYAGAGFRMAQAAAVMQDQYNSLRSIEAIGGEWDELKEAARPRPLDPAGNEPLLTPRLILEAVGKIGPAVSQEFYRTLAGETDVEGRLEAGRQLVAANPADREKNVPILKNLLADSDSSVQLAAAVSLLLLNEDAGRQSILAALAGSGPGARYQALVELERAKGRLDFARKEIAACAADPSASDDVRALARRLLR